MKLKFYTNQEGKKVYTLKEKIPNAEEKINLKFSLLLKPPYKHLISRQ